jgi:hypothetical protein
MARKFAIVRTLKMVGKPSPTSFQKRHARLILPQHPAGTSDSTGSQ